jgi:micrococcal nuclease
VVPTETPVEATEAPVEEPALEPQAPSVNPEEPPAQEFVEGGLRYSIDGASTGTSVPELPEIAQVTYGEWVVLALEAQNWTGQEQVFDMREFTLLADGQPIQVDPGNSWVASMMGYTPAYGNTDAILWAPGESHQFVLTFLAPTDAQSLVLQAGEQQFDLTSMLASTPSLADMRQDPAPEPMDATVVEVIDGETIVIEKDGIQQTVRYLGIDVPGEDDCYVAESTEANRALVEGQAVKIERQATDVDAQGNWVRDVWVEGEDGKWVLVSHQLVQQGAATADISEPNTRFASWLRGAEAAAHAEGRGLWGACQQGVVGEPLTTQVTLQHVDPARRSLI